MQRVCLLIAIRGGKFMKIIIDRFEGEFAIVELENKKMVNLPILCVPTGAKEGTVLMIDIDNVETEKRQERITELMNNIWKD